jgi:hypothetical protein
MVKRRAGAEWRKQNPNKVVSGGDVGKPRPSENHKKC